MREAQWERERQARINLMKDVYVAREKDILLKQEQKRESIKDNLDKQLEDPDESLLEGLTARHMLQLG